MKHRLLKLGVFLLLGAMVNVAVAWGCMLLPRWIPVRQQLYWISAEHAEENDRLWNSHTGGHLDVQKSFMYSGYEQKGIGLATREIAGSVVLENPNSPAFNVRRTLCGLPLHAMSLEMWVRAGQSGVMSDGVRIRDRAFPIWPLWPGFAVNTIFYAAILWLLWIAPGKVRRFVRVRRHRCPACGYQIASAPGIGPLCSECGATLPWIKPAGSRPA